MQTVDGIAVRYDSNNFEITFMKYLNEPAYRTHTAVCSRK